MTPIKKPVALGELHKGMSFGYLAKRGYFASPEGLAQVDRMADLGVTWVALMVSVMQETWHSTRLYQDFEFTVEDHELEQIIARFHARGVRVMLKPMVECLDSAWRGHISFPDGDQQIQGRVVRCWDPWFESLRASVEHYARLAERTGCEMYCLGCELMSAEGANHNERWLRVVEATRKLYNGPICYDAMPHTLMDGPQPPEWLRSLDAVCVSYYSSAADATDTSRATVDTMVEKLKPTVERLRRVSEQLGGMPVIFGETGCRSLKAGAINPSEYRTSGDYDPEEQANYLEAMCRLFWSETWWLGFYWWKWDEQQYRPNYYTDKAGDTGFTLDGKAAAEVLRRWCAKDAPR